MNAWIDFKDLRRRLSFADVLRHYEVKLNITGEQHHGFCPLPSHGGKRKSASFSANLRKGIWQCFGCNQKGNLLDFGVLMEHANPENGDDVRRVAFELWDRFLSSSPGTRTPKDEANEAEAENVIVNAPLDFELKNLEAPHSYCFGRGFNEATMFRFGLGLCFRGVLADRLAIPLHDFEGRLVGYAGRVIFDETITEENPKYKCPGRRRRKNVIHEFRKSLLLYNAHRIGGPVDDLVVVEGFSSVWWLSQAGIASVVATMGASCSEEQANAIVSLVSLAGRVWVLTDGDSAGARCAGEILVRVTPHRFARWIRLDNGKQPTGFAASELKNLLPF